MLKSRTCRFSASFRRESLISGRDARSKGFRASSRASSRARSSGLEVLRQIDKGELRIRVHMYLLPRLLVNDDEGSAQGFVTPHQLARKHVQELLDGYLLRGAEHPAYCRQSSRRPCAKAPIHGAGREKGVVIRIRNLLDPGVRSAALGFLARDVFDSSGQFFNGRLAEDLSQRHLDFKISVDPAHHLSRLQAVAPEIEEVVMDADLIHAPESWPRCRPEPFPWRFEARRSRFRDRS